MGRSPHCTPAEIDRLFDLRDVRKLKWREIVDIIGGTESGLCARYIYYANKRRVEAMRVGRPVPAKPQKFRGVTLAASAAPAPAIAKPSPAMPKALPPAIECRPRYFHDADADLAARIRRQGITAGVLGDPPPGRSALDQRRAP